MAEESNLKPTPSSSPLNESSVTSTPPPPSSLSHHLKQKPRYRNSISTESPIVMLTPPNPDEVIREERRLSNASAHSVASSVASSKSNKDYIEDDEQHLLPPTEPEPEEIVAKLISQRRPSTITTLSQVIKQIFIDKKIKEDGIPSKIIDGIYLGSIGAAKNLQWLKSNGITHIVCVAGGIGECFPKQFKYKVVDINDAPNEDISSHFKSCFNFIENALNNENGRVLIHCFAGMSRSVTITAAYLMQKKQMYAVPALKFVKQCRQQANPNAGFIVQLIKFQKIIGLKKINSYISPSDDDIDISASDYDEHDDEQHDDEQHDDEQEEEEEKLDKPQKNTGNAFGKIATFAMQNKQKSNSNSSDDNNNDNNNDKLKIPMKTQVKEWENGRRPSLFTALAKLRGMKNRSRANSTDSALSNISAMSTTNNEHAINNNNNNNNNNDNTLKPISATSSISGHKNDNNGNAAVSPVSPLDDQPKLHLLKEVSNETDESNILGVNKKKEDLNYLSKHIAMDTNKSNDDEDDVITPLEDMNDSFPNTPSDENKDNDVTNTAKISSTQL